MKVYLDLLFLLNISLDFILLLSVAYILNRNIMIRKIIYGSIIGGLSTFLLFIKLNDIQLFLFKIIISIVMTLATFSYKNIKYTFKNLEYLYIVSIILGGFLYMFNISLNNNLIMYLIVLIFLSPIILYLYYKQTKELKNNYSYYHKLDIYYKDKIIKLNAYLDTGNLLKDPYFNLDIIVTNEIDILRYIDDYILVPIDTINDHSLLKCIKVDKVLIDNEKLSKKVLIGITNKKINLEGIDSIIGLNIMEGLTC